MNRIVLSTVAVLVALVGFAMMGEDQEATAGLFGRKGCGAPACCEPAYNDCCEPVCGGRKHKCGGLFGRMRGRKCHKADCCEPVSCCAPAPTCCPEPTCCAPEQSCGCEAAPSCGCESQGCGCEAAAPCGCDGGQVISGDQGMSAPPAPEAAPEAPQGDAPAAPEAPEAPQGDAST
jgi:hypothetical protein